jgi:hypothetical protein
VDLDIRSAPARRISRSCSARSNLACTVLTTEIGALEIDAKAIAFIAPALCVFANHRTLRQSLA